MPRDGSGSYSLPAGNPVVTGTTISSTTHNNTNSDLATALTNSIAKDGQTTPTANLTMGTYRLTNLGAGTAVADAPRVSQVQNDAFTVLASVTGTNTITASATPTPAAYATGQMFKLVPANTNTGATTLNVSSLGAKNIFWNGAACVGGELRQNIPAYVEYDGTQFHLVANGFNAPFLDTHAVIEGSADSTKKVRFEVDGLTTATTRVVTAQDADGTMAYVADITGGTRAASFTTLSASGNVAINTNKFTVIASSGNALVAGDLKVGGYSGSNISSTGLGAAGSSEISASLFAATSSGQFIVGGTSIISASYRAQIATSGVGNTSAILQNTSNGSATADIANTDTAGDNKFFGFYTEAGYTLRGSIDFNRAGTATRYNTTSDMTLKTLIGDAPISVSLNLLRACRLREFYWNDDPTKKPQISPFAQELRETYKGAVRVGGMQEVFEDITEEVIENGEAVTVVVGRRKVGERYDPWGVDKTAYAWHLVAGWQYLDAKFKKLCDLLVAKGLISKEEKESL